MSTKNTIDIPQNEDIVSAEDLEIEEKKKKEEEKESEEENPLADDILDIIQGRYHIATTMRQTSGE